MKKFIITLVLGVLLVIPMSVKALAFDKDASGECEKICDTGAGKCQSVCNIYLKDNNVVLETLKTVSAGFSVGTGVTIVSVTPSDLFTTEGDYSNMTFTSIATDGVTDAKFKLATVKLEYDKNVDCTITFSLNGATQTITPKEPGAKTGVNLPVVILIGGAAIAIITYTLTNKNKKLYNI